MRSFVQMKSMFLVVACVNLLGVPTGAFAESKIGVLTLHGVGSQHEGSDFDAKLRRSLRRKTGEEITVVVKSVYYHGESRTRQAKLWKEYDRLEDKSPGLLDQKIIRRLMLATVGDALAYANHPDQKNSFYRQTHNEVRSAVDALHAELGDGHPVAVVGHSLGCKVIFDYLCDAQAGKGIWDGSEHPSKFQKLADLRLLITTGCNLPFFESAVPATEQTFFHFDKDFQWVNFYDRDDLLGRPLRPLGGRFAEIVQDEERNKIGSIMTSHIKYWKDDALNEEIAGRIMGLIRTNTAAGTDE